MAAGDSTWRLDWHTARHRGTIEMQGTVRATGEVVVYWALTSLEGPDPVWALTGGLNGDIAFMRYGAHRMVLVLRETVTGQVLEYEMPPSTFIPAKGMRQGAHLIDGPDTYHPPHIWSAYHMAPPPGRYQLRVRFGVYDPSPVMHMVEALTGWWRHFDERQTTVEWMSYCAILNADRRQRGDVVLELALDGPELVVDTQMDPAGLVRRASDWTGLASAAFREADQAGKTYWHPSELSDPVYDLAEIRRRRPREGTRLRLGTGCPLAPHRYFARVWRDRPGRAGYSRSLAPRLAVLTDDPEAFETVELHYEWLQQRRWTTPWGTVASSPAPDENLLVGWPCVHGDIPAYRWLQDDKYLRHWYLVFSAWPFSDRKRMNFFPRKDGVELEPFALLEHRPPDCRIYTLNMHATGMTAAWVAAEAFDDGALMCRAEVDLRQMVFRRQETDGFFPYDSDGRWTLCREDEPPPDENYHVCLLRELAPLFQYRHWTDDAEFRQVFTRAVGYCLRRMRLADGSFFGTPGHARQVDLESELGTRLRMQYTAAMAHALFLACKHWGDDYLRAVADAVRCVYADFFTPAVQAVMDLEQQADHCLYHLLDLELEGVEFLGRSPEELQLRWDGATR